MIEIGLGQYPYPPETYSNVFAQLTAIVHGDPPELPEEKYSEEARDWVAQCLRKDPERRASYRELLVSVRISDSASKTDVTQDHPFLVENSKLEVDMVGWVERALEYRKKASTPTPVPPLPQSV